MPHHKVVIIGSGPAGLTAAIYAGRALLEPLVIGGRELGGQLMWTTDVDNYPGFPQGIMGPYLMANMQKQAERFDAKIVAKNVTAIDVKTKPFKVTYESGEVTADVVILAMGADHKHLGLESEERLRGKGVSYCATCDGFFFKGKDIAVIGGGDTAMEEATFLTKFANKVYIVHRRDEFRASEIMLEEAKANPKIEFIINSQVKEVLGDTNVTGLRLVNNQTNQESTLAVQGMFVAVGLKPNSGIVEGQIELDTKKYIIVTDHVSTSVSGLFVAGDVHDHKYRQAVTAAGLGCMAAIEAERYLKSQST